MADLPNLTDPPVAPSRADSTNFSARADAFLGWFSTAWTNLRAVVSYINASVSDVATNRAAAAASATAASSSASAATAKASDAASSATSASTSAAAATTKASEAASSATSASTSASTATTKASEAASSATSASTSASTATTKASEAASSSTSASTSAATATTKAVDAASSATSAALKASEASASAAAAAAVVQKWIGGTSYSQGAVVWSPINYFTYRCKTNINGSTDPSSDGANWVLVGGIPKDLQISGYLLAASLREKRVDLTSTGSNIDLSSGNLFTKTISSVTSLSVSNVPSSGTVICFILELTGGGNFTVNWWPNIQWPYGSSPILTSNKDVLGFYTHDGGATWTGKMIVKDSR